RQPQDADRKARRDPADDARPRRHPAALQIGRPRRLQGIPPRRRPLMAARRKPHPHRNQPHPLARLPRRRRPPRPRRLPPLEPLRSDADLKRLVLWHIWRLRTPRRSAVGMAEWPFLDRHGAEPPVFARNLQALTLPRWWAPTPR